jgi:hypothetical protein
MNSELTLDLSDDQARPYFLWSEEMTLGELKAILEGSQGDISAGSTPDEFCEKRA